MKLGIICWCLISAGRVCYLWNAYRLNEGCGAMFDVYCLYVEWKRVI